MSFLSKPYLFYILPHHAISCATFWLTRRRGPWVPLLIRWFIHQYQINLDEAETADITAYPDFNTFFTRRLKPQARPLAEGSEIIVSPVDGTVSAHGSIEETQILQAKGRFYSLIELLGGEIHAKPYQHGMFVTLYLSPQDYHRVHMPVSGRLTQMTYVPGRLFSVAPDTVTTIPRLFARNERVITHFDTSWGPMAMVLVGAINVAAIETVWGGLITPPHRKRIKKFDYSEKPDAPHLQKGTEMGQFNLGSTVILLFPQDIMHWRSQLKTITKVRVGEAIGRFAHPSA